MLIGVVHIIVFFKKTVSETLLVYYNVHQKIIKASILNIVCSKNYGNKVKSKAL